MQSSHQEVVAAWLPEAGDVVGDKYVIERVIARGGMGVVFAATHRVTGRKLALKWLLSDRQGDADATHRLIREAQAAARVRHPNVVDVYDVGEHDGSLFLVMELLEGQTLAELLRQRGALPAHEALQLLVPAMRGVLAAHRNQVVHRDLKPSNIFLSQGEATAELAPRVLDFGICKLLQPQGTADHTLTRTGEVVGTPFYMAPEQLADDAIDQRVDVYALGIILYQTLSGRLPFHDHNYNNLIVKIATATPAPLHELRPELPRALCDAVMRAFARPPSARFPDVAALLAALEPFARRVSSSRPAPAKVAGRWVGSRRLLVLTAFVALVSVGWLLALALRPGTPPPTAAAAASRATPPVTPLPPATTTSAPVAPLPSAASPASTSLAAPSVAAAGDPIAQPSAVAATGDPIAQPSAVAAAANAPAPPAAAEPTPAPPVSASTARDASLQPARGSTAPELAPKPSTPRHLRRRKLIASVGSKVTDAESSERPVQISPDQF